VKAPLHVYERSQERHSVVRGGPVHQLVEGTPVRALWDRRERGYLVRSDRLPDLLAMAEVAGWRVVVHREGEVSR
jgi:hypothetical protein